MCIIVAKPKGTVVSFETLKHCWDANPDGAGMAAVHEGRVEIEKGFMSWHDLLDAYEDPEIWRDSAMLLHFRIATHGYIDEANTHPFEVIPGKLAFAHNGILTGMQVTGRPELSDTQVFNRYILQQLPHNFLASEAMCMLILSSIGSNKLAFLDQYEHIKIFNDKLGTYREDGVWFSNYDYLGRTTYYGGYYKGWKWDRREDGAWGWKYNSPDPWDNERTSESTALAKPDDILDTYSEEFYCADCAHTWWDDVDYMLDGGADEALHPTPACPLCGNTRYVTLLDDMFAAVEK